MILTCQSHQTLLLRSLISREQASQPLKDLRVANVELTAGFLTDGLPDVVPAVDADAELLEELTDGDLQWDGVAIHGLIEDQFEGSCDKHTMGMGRGLA